MGREIIQYVAAILPESTDERERQVYEMARAMLDEARFHEGDIEFIMALTPHEGDGRTLRLRPALQ